MRNKPHHSDNPTLRPFDDYQLYIGTGRANHFGGPDSGMTVAIGQAGSDRMRGSSMEDELIGGEGNDHLIGAAGADHLVGGPGNDWLVGGDQADTLMAGPGNDVLDEGTGHGDLDGGSGNDLLIGGPGADAFMISPDSGHDIITDFRAGPGVFDHLAVMNIEPEQFKFQDTRTGVLISWDTAQGDGSVLLAGVWKNDLAQDDFMFADDRHLINPTSADADHVTAKHFVTDEGNEVAPASPRATSPQFQVSVDDSHIQFGSDAVADVFQATAKNDLYFGLGGDDRLHGGAGDDHLAGDAGNDLLDGGDGGDDLRGGDDDDHLYGGAMNDNLMGGAGNDYLSAGTGHDMLEGGEGDDTYNGGDGADAFMVSRGSGNDVVVGGFDAGPGAFDHIAFMDVLPNEISVTDSVSTHGDGHAGVLVSWGDGSIFIEGINKSQMAQDDFMFNAIEGGAFVPDPQISTAGSEVIFQDAHSGWLMA